MDRNHEWRCKRCGKLLGVRDGDRLHIRFTRSHEYLVGFPATGTCRACGTLNELPPSGARKVRGPRTGGSPFPSTLEALAQLPQFAT